MDKRHLQLIEEISNAKYRKAMAQKAIDQANSVIAMKCAQLCKSTFSDGNYTLNGILVRIETGSSYLKITQIVVKP